MTNKTNTAVIIPSYNTKNSIVKTIKQLLKYLPNIEVIVVDDNSPDKSYKLVQEEFLLEKRVKLIVRENKGGRGSAVLRGFEEGLKNKDIEFFIEMDADLCHHPKYISLLIKQCLKYDIVIASKYLKESKIIGLDLKRRIFSKAVNFYIKFMLKIPVTDFTNGFRCYRRNTLEKVDFNSFMSKGFIVLSEILYKIHKNGHTFSEIPFIFTFNTKNKSNLNSAEIKEAFFTILKLKLNIK